MKAILLDIEGTTTPIDFVHKVLFPYAKSRVAGYVMTHFDALAGEIQQLVVEGDADGVSVDRNNPESISTYLEFLIDRDLKSTPLKSIQGKIWKEGYEAGELRSIVFDDVPPAFERWADSGIVSIYSSGSVLAQQLLFRYTDHGDLTPHISSYFDTEIGGKRESESYEQVALRLECDPDEILFCSDVTAELDAANRSGMQTVLVIRPGNEPVDDAGSHRIVDDFDDLDYT
jgi:enolase-phosphatase E1